MNKRQRKKLTKRPSMLPPKPSSATFNADIVGVLSGRGVFLTRPNNDGLPMGPEPPLALYATALHDCRALSQIPTRERQIVLASLSATLRQAAYHRHRFDDFLLTLERRRANVPGDVVWDALGTYVHFELRAYTGALRTALDEIAYLIARRAGASSKAARSAPWATSDLFTKSSEETNGLPEVVALKAHADWFDWLNAFRNSFYHHGWVSGTGHYPADQGGVAALDPELNALLVPDRESLRGRGKPFEWSWTEGNRVDDLARRFEAGIQSLLQALFGAVWQVTPPAPGTVPEAGRPTMMVAVPTPVYGSFEGEAFVPLFSNTESALRFAAGRQNLHELRRLSVVELAQGVRGASFSTAGIEKVVSKRQTHLHVLIDPAPFVENEKLNCIYAERLDLRTVLSDSVRVVTVPVAGRDVFMWIAPQRMHPATDERPVTPSEE